MYLTFEIKSYAVWDFQMTDNAVKGHSKPLPNPTPLTLLPLGPLWTHMSPPMSPQWSKITQNWCHICLITFWHTTLSNLRWIPQNSSGFISSDRSSFYAMMLTLLPVTKIYDLQTTACSLQYLVVLVQKVLDCMCSCMNWTYLPKHDQWMIIGRDVTKHW